MKNSIIAVVALLGLAACSDSKNVATEPNATISAEGTTAKAAIAAKQPAVASLTITAPTKTLTVGQTLQLTATTRDASGKVITGRSLTWGSSHTSIATISTSGLVKAIAPGTDSVGAIEPSGKYGAIVITVKPAAGSAPSTSPVASVTITAPTKTITVGQTLQLAATTIDASGKVVTGRSLTWGSMHTAIATINSTGLVTAMAPGTDSVGAMEAGGKYGAVVITVKPAVGTAPTAPSAPSAPSSPSAPAAPSAPSGSSGTPILLEDFSSYSSTSNLLANPRGIWATVEAKNTNHIVLDQSVGYGSSKQAMRYDWPNNGAQCLDYAIKPGMLKIPGNLKHVWIEFVVRFSTNFSVNAGASGCASEYKLASLGDYSHGVGRWNIAEMQAGQFNADAPGGPFAIVSTPKPSTLWDGQPHVFRAEAQLGNGNGLLRMWVDGKLIVNQTGLTTDSSQQVIDIFGPGLNINQGPGVSGMQMWWHKIAVYSSNPGWN